VLHRTRLLIEFLTRNLRGDGTSPNARINSGCRAIL
jgi:hypothetical protein